MIFENIRLKIGSLILRKRRAKVNRQKALYDFATAKYVGIVCNTDDEDSTNKLKTFLQFLSQKNINYLVIGYFDHKKVPDNFLYWKGFEFFTRKDLDLFFIPKIGAVDVFIQQSFDLLINCSIKEFFPIEYIIQLSSAKCKVGVLHSDDSGYDLMIDIKQQETVEYFLENLQLYLSDLRNHD